MDIHKPKPWHGLREFLKEYAIIVVGVLTALAAEQAVEAWRSRETLSVLNAALSQELGEDRGRWELLRKQDDCMERRVRGLIAWTRSAPPGVAHEDLGALMLPSVHASAWELARSSPAFTHMPIGQQMAYSSLYDALANQQHYLYEEQQRWHEINGLVNLSDEPEARRFLARDLSTALGYQKRRQLSYAYMFRRFDALNIRPDTSVLTDLQLMHCES